MTVPIAEVNGHLALDIGVFPRDVHKMDAWKNFTNMIANADSQKLEFVADERTVESVWSGKTQSLHCEDSGSRRPIRPLQRLPASRTRSSNLFGAWTFQWLR